MSCVDCSGEDRESRVGINGNVNPLDCNTQFMQCGNPCHVGPANTPQCESLPSQIENFTTQFFGVVVKTEVDGNVVWSLPCSLDVGLPNNPRGVDEGLACYFLRLFRDGIGGLTGPKGEAGTPGTDGHNTYTVTLQNFTQPTIESPLKQIVVSPNPSIMVGIGLFIEGSGSYQVTNVEPNGVVFITLVSALDGAPSVIPAGALVVPVGVPGAGLGPKGPKGDTGPQGPQGIPGIPGSSLVNESGVYSAISTTGLVAPGSADYVVTGSYAVVNFTSAIPGFTPSGAGRYLVNVVLGVNGLIGVATSDQLTVQLYSSTSGPFYQSTVFVNNLVAGQELNVAMTSVIQTSGTIGEKVQLRAFATNGGVISIAYLGTYVTWVRVA